MLTRPDALDLGDERGVRHGNGFQLIGVRVFEHLVLVLFDKDRTGRADLDASCTADAAAVRHGLRKRGADLDRSAASARGEVVHGLHSGADVHAALALDALVGVPDDDTAVVHGIGVVLLLERELIDLILTGEALQLTEAVALAVAEEAPFAEFRIEVGAFRAADAQTVMAVDAVVGEQQLQRELSGLAHGLGVRMDDHTLTHLRGAGVLEGARALDLDDAHAAGGVRLELL